MGLREQRKKIQRSIIHLSGSYQDEIVLPELEKILLTVQSQVNLIRGTHASDQGQNRNDQGQDL